MKQVMAEAIFPTAVKIQACKEMRIWSNMRKSACRSGEALAAL